MTLWCCYLIVTLFLIGQWIVCHLIVTLFLIGQWTAWTCLTQPSARRWMRLNPVYLKASLKDTNSRSVTQHFLMNIISSSLWKTFFGRTVQAFNSPASGAYISTLLKWLIYLTFHNVGEIFTSGLWVSNIYPDILNHFNNNLSLFFWPILSDT